MTRIAPARERRGSLQRLEAVAHVGRQHVLPLRERLPDLDHDGAERRDLGAQHLAAPRVDPASPPTPRARAGARPAASRSRDRGARRPPNATAARSYLATSASSSASSTCFRGGGAGRRRRSPPGEARLRERGREGTRPRREQQRQ